MKRFKMIFSWIIVSLFLQCFLLFFLNNFFFTSDGAIRSKKIELKKEDRKKLANIDISEYVKDIKLSFDGKYVSYLEDGTINVVNTRDGKSIQMESGINAKILNYNWLNDRHRMLVTQRNNSTGMVGLYYFDVVKNEKNIIKDICKIDKNGKVNSIDASTLTDVTYIMMTNYHKDKFIYRLDINQKLTKVDLMCNAIDKIGVVPHEDRLVYGDYLNKNLYVTSPNKRIKFNDSNSIELLSIDNEDEVFIGELNKKEICKIKYGTLKENTSAWKTIDLKESQNKENILINLKGMVFLNSEIKGKLINLKDNKEYEYKGKLIGVFDDGYGYIYNGKLKINYFN